MATASRQSQYAERTVYGSLAYDFERAANFEERLERPVDRQVVIPAPPQIREEAAQTARVKTQQTVAPFAIIGFVCVAVLLVFTLMAKIQLTEITDSSAQLESQLSDLQVAQNRLLIEYEKAFNLTEIEEYATDQLGMQRPRDEQLFYLAGTVPDKAVVLDGDDGESFGNRVFDLLASLAEYFR